MGAIKCQQNSTNKTNLLVSFYLKIFFFIRLFDVEIIANGSWYLSSFHLNGMRFWLTKLNSNKRHDNEVAENAMHKVYYTFQQFQYRLEHRISIVPAAMFVFSMSIL